MNAVTWASYNTAVGTSALNSLTTASNNTAVGYLSLNALTIGSDHTAIGYQALKSVINGQYCIAVGGSALYSTTSGFQCVAVGHQSMYTATSGSYNTSCGPNNLYYLTTGSYNTCLGKDTGFAIVTGSKNTFIGTLANATGDYTQSSCLGYGASVTGNNQVVLGSITETVICPNILKVATSIQINNSTIIHGVKFGYSAPAGASGAVTVSFGYTFTSTPIITTTLVYSSSASMASIYISAQSTTSFTYNVINTSNTHVENLWGVNWTATI